MSPRPRHGHTRIDWKSPTYLAWTNMKSRCQPGYDQHLDYDGRGIAVCDRWQVFDNFLTDMGEKPDGMTLERSNNALGYSKENCVWASWRDQTRNKRSNRMVTWSGRTQCVTDWATEIGVHPRTLHRRLFEAGWSVDDALTTLAGPYHGRRVS